MGSSVGTPFPGLFAGPRRPRGTREYMEKLKKGNEVELRVEKLAFGGKAIAKLDGFVVFLERAVPGQLVRAVILRKKRQFAEARVTEVLSQSPDYLEPFCPHFGVCGGCQWQDLDYAKQLEWKRLHVLESLEHVGGVEGVGVEPTVPSPDIRYYRNKMEFTFSDRRWLLPSEIAEKEVQYNRTCALGLHVRGHFDKIFNVETCFLESPLARDILVATREWCQSSGLPPYSIRSQEGFWRFLVVREGKRTGQTLVHLITTPDPDSSAVEELSAELLRRFPAITTIVHSTTGKKSQVAMGEWSRVIHGPGTIEERLGDFRYRISAHSFFQTNPLGAEGLYRGVLECGGFTGDENVWDLYCGTGSIAIFISRAVGRVTGFEMVPEAIEDAWVNARMNGVDNCAFAAIDLKDFVEVARETAGRTGTPDVIIADPPRAGIHKDVGKVLLDILPEKLVLVSCNPATLARDLALVKDRYEIRRVRPFDLFPHTAHVECVVSLVRRPC